MSWLPRRNVVAPVDFSPESLEAVDVALDIAGGPENVHLVHILPEISVTDPGVVWQTVDDEHRTQHAREALRKKFSDPKYANISIHVAIGDPGHGVADYAQQTHADLVVISSHGRTGLRRLLIGSVAERVVRLSHCPVLVLRK